MGNLEAYRKAKTSGKMATPKPTPKKKKSKGTPRFGGKSANTLKNGGGK